jgi:choice-of-anchor A domain-containing protein
MRFILIAFITLWALPVQADLVDCFGEAANYNLFVFNEATLNESEAEGSVAIGGDATLIDYEVGLQVVPGSDARLDVGGDLSYLTGQVGHGGTGSIFANSLSILSAVTPGGVTIPTPVDFAATEALVSANSLFWSGFAETGTESANFSNLTLDATGLGGGLQVFNIDATDIPLNDLIIQADGGATVLVNISGNGPDFVSLDVVAGGGVATENILFNVFEASQVTISDADLFVGAFLAPEAAVSVTDSDISGNVIVNSINGGVDVELPLFAGAGDLSKVPAPAALVLMTIGLTALCAGRRIKA